MAYIGRVGVPAIPRTPGDGSYIRETPNYNSPEYAMSNPEGQLAVAGLYGLQGAVSGITTEAVLAKVGLAAKLYWSTASATGDALGGFGVQTSFKATTEYELTVGTNQFFKKFGEHYQQMGLPYSVVGRDGYLNGIQNTFLNGTVKQIPSGVIPHGGETHFLQNGNLLRVKNGQFRSYYPLQ